MSPDVLVVGAGPVGLMLGCRLRRRGVACRIVDEKDGPATHSKALGVQARTLEILATMGLAQAALEKGRALRALEVHGDGRRLGTLTFDGVATDYPFVLVLPQSDTERILLADLARHGGEVEWRTKLTALSPTDDGIVATLAAAGGATEMCKARWLCGCDGAHSTVRHQLGVKFEGSAYPELFLLADVRPRWELPPERGHIYLSREGTCIALPFAEPGAWRLIFALQGGEPRPATTSRDEVLALVRARTRLAVELDGIAWAAMFRIHRRMARSWRVERCVLAGDAAHIHSPAGGQGMNIGLHDAHDLAAKLALVLEGRGEELLDAYERARRKVAARTLRRTDLVTRGMTLQNGVLRALRNRAVSLALHVPAVRARIARAIAEVDGRR